MENITEGSQAPKAHANLPAGSEPPIRDQDKLWNIVETLSEIGAAHNVSAAPIALAWLLTRPAISSLVVGGRTPAQFEENFRAVDLTLSDDEIDRLNKVSEVPLIYPYWHQSNFASERFCEADWALHEQYRGRKF